MPRTPQRASRRVRIRPHDAFDLIRLLARSQSDPRKAVAELRFTWELQGPGELDAHGERRTAGIPEPQPVRAPGEDWRSRRVGGRWEYNAAHRDYLEASESEARRLRYLVNQFAKEIVLRNFGGPGDAQVLERMVEVLTYLDPGARRTGG